MAMLVWVAILAVVTGAVHGDCGEELLDIVAELSDQFRNVDEGVYRNFQKREFSESPDFQSVVSEDLRQDICDLTKFSSGVFTNCETCPGCGSEELRCDFKELDLAVLLDESSSISPENFQLAKAFIANLVSKLNVGNDKIRVSLSTFAFKVKTHFYFNDFINRLDEAKEAVMNIPRSGTIRNTRTDMGLKTIRTEVAVTEKGDRPLVSTYTLLLTDGQSSRPKATLDELAMWDSDSKIVVVAVGSDIDRIELVEIASKPLKEHFFVVDDFSSLSAVAEKVLQFACKGCDPPCENGSECAKITNTCNCPPRYIGRRCQTMTLCPVEE